MMRDFKRNGLIHWQRNGESPCGATPLIKLGSGTTLFGWRPGDGEPVFATPCEVCTSVREAFFKFLRNGGSMQGWDIRPNPDREDAA